MTDFLTQPFTAQLILLVLCSVFLSACGIYAVHAVIELETVALATGIG